jgi:hypothetical protein
MRNKSEPWPALMTARVAASYCDMTVSSFNGHVREGRIVAAGRRGGVGPKTFAIEELHRFLRGDVRTKGGG